MIRKRWRSYDNNNPENLTGNEQDMILSVTFDHLN